MGRASARGALPSVGDAEKNKNHGSQLVFGGCSGAAQRPLTRVPAKRAARGTGGVNGLAAREKAPHSPQPLKKAAARRSLRAPPLSGASCPLRRRGRLAPGRAPAHRLMLLRSPHRQALIAPAPGGGGRCAPEKPSTSAPRDHAAPGAFDRAVVTKPTTAARPLHRAGQRLSIPPQGGLPQASMAALDAQTAMAALAARRLASVTVYHASSAKRAPTAQRLGKKSALRRKRAMMCAPISRGAA